MARSNSATANAQQNGQTEMDNLQELQPLETKTADGKTYESGLMIAPESTTIQTQQYHSFLALAKQLPAMTPTFSISSKYYEFNSPGQSVRGIFLGNTWIQTRDESTGELKPIEAVSWLDESGEMYINAGAALVSCFRQFAPPKGCPVEIEFEGKNGRTKIYNVRVLVS